MLLVLTTLLFAVVHALATCLLYALCSYRYQLLFMLLLLLYVVLNAIAKYKMS